jgi:mediator of RNA polymerase II transcription subunit 5
MLGDTDAISATSPITFLKLSATLVQQSIEAAVAKVIDIDTLRGGLSYFAQPLLSWCTGSVVSWLCEEIPRQGCVQCCFILTHLRLLSAVHLDVLQTLVSSSGFPKAILKLTGPEVARLLRPGLGLEAVIQSANIDSTGLIAKIGVAGIGPERQSGE